MIKKDAESIVHHLVETGELERTRSYLARGRALANLTDGQLVERLVLAYSEWRSSGFWFGAAEHKLTNDVAAEFAMRGTVVPYDLVQEDLDALAIVITAEFDALSEVEQEEINSAIIADFAVSMKHEN